MEHEHVQLLPERAAERGALRAAVSTLITTSPSRLAAARPRERQDVRRLVLAAVAGVQPPHRRVARQHHHELAGHARAAPRRPSPRAAVGRRTRAAGAGGSGCRPDRCRAPLVARRVAMGGVLLRGLCGAVGLIGLDDGLHQPVADHVPLVEVARTRCRSPRESTGSPRPDPRSGPAGRSICVMSPVTTTLEPRPRRVRNIFICSVVVFWASSMMTKASLRVRPRMKARGATSITLRSSRRADLLVVEQVVERVVERAQVGIDLLLQVAGQEAELLARLDGGAREDDARDRLREQSGHGLATAR